MLWDAVPPTHGSGNGWTRPPSGCWLWTGKNAAGGYGYVEWTKALAHRHAWESLRGPIPAGMLVRHTCDVPACINPAHLRVGTRQENTADALARQRVAAGTHHPAAIFTADQVREIRARYANGETQWSLGNEFGASRSTIWALLTGKTYKHVK